jgi:predicted dehydrogenase
VEAQAVGKAAASAESFLMPAMCMRFWPEWAWLKQVVSDNRYGNVLSASFLRQGTIPPGWYREGTLSGGALLDLHIHDTDFVCNLFGKPKAVSSRGYRALSGQVDHVSTQYHYDNVPLVVADGGWSFAVPYPFRMRYTVNFERDVTADFDLARPEALVVYERGEARPIICEGIDGWFGTVRYFVNCILEGAKPSVVTVDDAVQATQVVEAEARSIANNRIEAV